MTQAKQSLIRRRFSDAAPHYGILSQVQRGIAHDLVDRIGDVSHKRILDVGAGDGALTKRFFEAGADVIALDLAWGMVRLGREHCPPAAWVQADACALPFANRSFEMVASSSTYQWVNDLTAAFKEARRVLKPGGRLTAAMFGRATLIEFFESLERAAGSLKKPLAPMKRLGTADDVRCALKASRLRNIRVRVDRREVSFASVTALLVWLKGIGANSLSEKFFWGKGLLASTEKEYRSQFLRGNELRASFEVIWIEAVK